MYVCIGCNPKANLTGTRRTEPQTPLALHLRCSVLQEKLATTLNQPHKERDRTDRRPRWRCTLGAAFHRRSCPGGRAQSRPPGG